MPKSTSGKDEDDMKKICFVVLLAVLLIFIGSGNLLAASDDIKVYVNGNQVVFPDQKPMINADSRTLVPVRFVSEALGADVEWDGVTNTVSIAHEGKAIGLVIGQRTAQVDAGSVVLDTAAALVGGRTMVPLRFVSECLGAEVQWDGYARAIYITTSNQAAAPFVGKPFIDAGIKNEDGSNFFGTLIPGEPPAQYMYVTVDQLPVKVGDTTILDIVPGEDIISVKFFSPDCYALRLLLIQDGIIIGSRYGGQKLSPSFTQVYDTKNMVDESLGTPRVDITKVSAFAFDTFRGANLYIIIKNPLYKGDWSL